MGKLGTLSPGATFNTAFNKVAEIETAEGISSFEYDASGSRVYRYSTADMRETVHVGELYQRHVDLASGDVQHQYYVPGLERLVASVVEDVGPVGAERSVHYIHVDHLGSTDVVSGADGVVEQRMSYDVWGKRRDPSDWTLPDEFVELGPVNLGYTGHEAQEDGGLINMRGRMYDPHIGRMASADPFVVDPLSTQGWNRFAYVLNNPLGYTDPSGYEPDEPETVDDDGGDVEVTPDPDNPNAGLIGKGEARQEEVDSKRDGGTYEVGPKADQRAGDSGPSGDTGTSGGPGGGAGSGSVGEFGAEWFALAPRIFVAPPHPLDGFAGAMIETRGETNESQERRRRQAADDAGDAVIETMQNPPAYVDVSISMTLFILGGNLELLGSAAQGVKVLIKGGADDALPLVAGTVRRKARGSAGGPRAGKPFTKKGKREIDAANAERNGGVNACENCGTEVVPGQRSQRDIRPPGNERQRDHIIPKSKGGDGDPSNGQVLCRDCNLQKSDKL